MVSQTKRPPIPITVFTGFLGAGKTSIILSLLPQLPSDYKVVLLKNEFGDIEVDSKLAKQSNLSGVSEILNGCMCCILVGQMENALLEIRDKFRPDRIIIECSGSAFPATLAFQIRKIERETKGDLKLDSIITVIDAENFSGYEDTSPTAKMQASYSDIILINKWEHISERALDDVIDHLNTLNDQTPKIRCQKGNGVDPNLIFGLESKLFAEGSEGEFSAWAHHDEVETVSIYRGGKGHHHGHDGGEACDCDRQDEAGTEDSGAEGEYEMIEQEELVRGLEMLSKEVVWRVKGFVHTVEDKWWILNWAFGRYEMTELVNREEGLQGSLRLTAMGERGEVKRGTRRFAEVVGARIR